MVILSYSYHFYSAVITFCFVLTGTDVLLGDPLGLLDITDEVR